MHYVYLLGSLVDARHAYVGLAHDLSTRLEAHSRGEVQSTTDHRPWTITSRSDSVKTRGPLHSSATACACASTTTCSSTGLRGLGRPDARLRWIACGAASPGAQGGRSNPPVVGNPSSATSP